jgi:hypothetical protein
MQRRIAIVLYFEQVATQEIKLLPGPPWLKLNPLQAHVYAIYQDWIRDSFVFVLTHLEFEPVPAGAETPCYSIDQARARFPYLFIDVNPILFRKFNL